MSCPCDLTFTYDYSYYGDIHAKCKTRQTQHNLSARPSTNLSGLDISNPWPKIPVYVSWLTKSLWFQCARNIPNHYWHVNPMYLTPARPAHIHTFIWNVGVWKFEEYTIIGYSRSNTKDIINQACAIWTVTPHVYWKTL